MDEREQTESWSLVGGDVALDFVNTVGGYDATAHLDAVATYELLLVWSLRAGTIEQEQADRLLRRARRSPGEADEVMARVRALRPPLYDVLHSLLDGVPSPAAWHEVRPAVTEAVAHAEPVADQGEVRWSWAGVRSLDAPLHPVAHAAARLLTDPRAGLLRRCGRCRWLFLDESRNHARRWCDMSTCGVAEKVERQSERRRAARGTS